MIRLITWPIRLLWGLLGAVLSLTGRLIGALLGAVLMAAGILLCFTVVGAVVGIPLVIGGFSLMVGAIF